jgi:UMF1 family MFS transporter
VPVVRTAGRDRPTGVDERAGRVDVSEEGSTGRLARAREPAARAGLRDRATTSWALYDWANSAFATTVVAAVFPVYYRTAIGADLPGNLASAYFGYTTATSLALVAVLVPVLGALADYYRSKKRLLAAFLALGVASTAGLFFAGPDGPLTTATTAALAGVGVDGPATGVVAGSVLFGLGNVGFVGANVFYDSLLPHVARAGSAGEAVEPGEGEERALGARSGEAVEPGEGEERALGARSGEAVEPGEGDATVADRLSTAGFALGYLGGGVLLVVNLAWVSVPGVFGFPDAETATRVALLSVAVWWAAFALPLFRYVDEPTPETPPERLAGGPVRIGVGRLGRTLASLPAHRDLLVFLLAFLLYADGIGTIIRMASIYGAEVGISRTGIVGALVAVQFLGIPFAFAFGSLADRVSAKRALAAGLVVYVGISIGGYFMRTEWQFWALAIAVATVQGGTQALSRSIYASLVPPDRSSEFFAFFSVSSKVAGVAGPAVFGVVSQVTGSARFSIVSLVVFFIGGLALLWLVDVEAGRRAAGGGTTAGDGSSAGSTAE